MKFLIATNGSDFSNRLNPKQFADHDFGVGCSEIFSLQNEGLYVISSQKPYNCSASEDDLVLWDGAAIDRDIAFSAVSPVVDAGDRLSRYVESISLNKAPLNLTGVFVGVKVSADGSFTITPDLLSQYAVFYICLGGQYLFSNSLHLIEKACLLLGAPKSRDFACSAYEVAFGVGAWTQTGLCGVHKIPPDHYVAHNRSWTNFVKFPSRVFNQRPDQSVYMDKLIIAAESLKNSMASLSRASPETGLVLDLSGGKDTRLILAAQLATQYNNFHVFLGGKKGGPDQQTASRLVTHYNLDSVDFLSNLQENEHLSAIEVARRAAYRYMGTSNLYQSDLGEGRLSNVAQVRGGSSEARTRSFFPMVNGKRLRKSLSYSLSLSEANSKLNILKHQFELMVRKKKWTKARLLARLLSRGKHKHFLFKKEFLHSSYGYLSNNIDWLFNAGVAQENIADALFLIEDGGIVVSLFRL